MKIKKIFYYLQSLFIIFNQLKNKIVLFNFIFDKNVCFYFKNGLKLQVTSWLDLLIIKENIFADFYQIKRLKNPQLIVDIGGGFGEFSIQAAKLFPKSQVLAFEPNSQLFKLMQKNIFFNKTKNIVSYQKAVSLKKTFNLNIAQEGTQSSFFKNKSKIKSIKVIGYDLNQLLKDNLIDFLKIDCEGGEWEIINGLKQEYLRRIKIISLEYHCQYVDKVDILIKRKLVDRGFKCKIQPDKFDSNIGHLMAIAS